MSEVSLAEAKAAMASFNNEYREAQVMSNGLPPDGSYQAKITRFSFIKGKSNGILYLKPEAEVTAPAEFQGYRVDTLIPLNDPEKMGRAKTFFNGLLGIGTEDYAEAAGELEQFIGAFVEVAVKTSTATDQQGNPYRNVYLNKLISAAPPVTSKAKSNGKAAAPVAPDDSDLPF